MRTRSGSSRSGFAGHHIDLGSVTRPKAPMERLLAPVTRGAAALVRLALAFFFVLGFSHAHAVNLTFQGCQATSGTLCQGGTGQGGVKCATPNPSDSLTFVNPNQNIIISMRNLGERTPCDVQFDVQQGDGVFNGTDFVVNNTQSGDLTGLAFPGPSKSVTYILGANDPNQSVKLKIGPPTGSNNNSSCNPQSQPENYSYEVTCAAPPKGSIKIKKTIANGTTPDAAAIFGFTTTNLAPANFNLNGSGTDSRLFSDLTTGQYAVTESTLPMGWSLSNITCTGQTLSTFSRTGNKLEIDLVGGENLVCSFENTKEPIKTGTLKIYKVSEGGTGTFDILASPNAGGAATSISVTTSGSPNGNGSNSASLPIGAYTVTEQVPNGWTLKSIVCGNSSGMSSATVTIADGQTSTCTVTNVKKVAAIDIEKTANPKTYTAPGQVITYTYKVTNTGNQPLINVTVTDDKLGPVCTIPGTLAAGAMTTCQAMYTIVAADITNGSVTNVGTVTGEDPDGNTPSDKDDETITFDKQGHIDRTKEVIRNFINRRVDLLASNEPDRARLLRRFNRQQPEQPGSMKDGPMKLGGSAEGGNGRFSFATSLSQIRAQAQAEAVRKAERARNGDAADAADDPTQTAALDEATGRDSTRPGAMRLGAAPDRPQHLMPVTQGGAPQAFDFWVEGHFQRWEDDAADADRSGKFGILYIGADYLVRPWLLVGALVQFDRMDDKSDVLKTEVNGNGWMAGPYMSMKLSENLIFDARAAWGQSDNQVNPFGVYTDEFETDRWLAKANLTGNWMFGRLRVTPSVGVIYVEERQKAYVDSVGVTIPGQKASIGRLSFGPEFGYAFEREDGSVVEPHISFTGMWDFDKDSTSTIGGLTVGNDDFRVKVEGGIIVRAPTGLSFRTTLSYDGIGADDFSAWGGQVWVNLPLN